MLTGSLQVLNTCCKLIFTILIHIINKITIFFPVYLQIFQIFARMAYAVTTPDFLQSLDCLFVSAANVASGCWVSFRLGCCDALTSLDFTFSSICLFLAKLTCASATALRPLAKCTEIGAIFGWYAQNECSCQVAQKYDGNAVQFAGVHFQYDMI